MLTGRKPVCDFLVALAGAERRALRNSLRNPSALKI
jgi:hypothetical protein